MAAAAAAASSFILSKSIIFPSSFRPLLPSTKRSVCPRKAAAGRPSPRRFIVASAAATIDSSNGAVSATEQKPIDSAEYGRQFFPLAAVVGQVHEFPILHRFSAFKCFFCSFIISFYPSGLWHIFASSRLIIVRAVSSCILSRWIMQTTVLLVSVLLGCWSYRI